jgi:YhcH/YjgK/YiaL family protein
MIKRILYILILSGSTLLQANADEGMWMLTDLKQQNAVAMMELGLEIPIDQVYNPNGISLKDAVVHFGGGCTGEVISSEGLVLTNHHCGYGAIQQQSSVEHDYLTDGFWAMNRNEELPCKDLTITFIDRILDVTAYVNEQLAKDEDPNGTNYLSPKYLETVADRFAKKPADAKLEIHDAYIDIQVLIRGEQETFGWSERADLRKPLGEFDAGKDIQFFDDEPQTFYTLRPGQFTILFPEDGHAPMIGEGNVRKIIVKVRK